MVRTGSGARALVHQRLSLGSAAHRRHPIAALDRLEQRLGARFKEMAVKASPLKPLIFEHF